MLNAAHLFGPAGSASSASRRRPEVWRAPELREALFDADPLDEFFDISSWLTAIVGSIVLLAIYRVIVNRRGASFRT
jgi:Transglycosylase associated protein